MEVASAKAKCIIIIIIIIISGISFLFFHILLSVALCCVFVGQLKVLRNGVWDGIFFSLVTGCDYHRLVLCFFFLLSFFFFPFSSFSRPLCEAVNSVVGWYLLFYRVGKT